MSEAIKIAEEVKTDVSATATENTSAESTTPADNSSSAAAGSQDAAVSEQEGTPESKPTEESAQVKETTPSYTERERQFQADKDRAEAQVKNIYKQILPFFEVDDLGQIKGLRTQSPQPTQRTMDELMDAALISGDKEAMKQILSSFKGEVLNEGLQKVQSASSIEKERASLRGDYKNMFKEDGSPNYEDPLFIEASKVIDEHPELSNPLKVRAAIEIAEGRMLKKGLPSIQQQIKNDAQTKLKAAKGNQSAINEGGQITDDMSALSAEQIAALKKEGWDEAGMKRIAKTVKQAKKEGGFML